MIGQAASAPASPVRAQSALCRLSRGDSLIRGDSQPASPGTPPQTDTRGSVFAAHRPLSGRTSSAASDSPYLPAPRTTQRKSSDAPGLPRAQTTCGAGLSSARSSGFVEHVGGAASKERHSREARLGGIGNLQPANGSQYELGRSVSARRRTSSASSVGMLGK